MVSPTDVSIEYFRTANAITAFYVVQTLLFANAIYKEKLLIKVLHDNQLWAQISALGFPIIYIIIIIGCYIAENSIQLTQKDPIPAILTATYLAAIARVGIVVLLSTYMSLIIYLIGKKPLEPVFQVGTELKP